MQINDENDIPNVRLRLILRFWQRLHVNGLPPTRADIHLEDLRSATGHTLFAKVHTPYEGLGSIQITNTGGGFVNAIGINLTGKTVPQVLTRLGDSVAFRKCFGEFDKAVKTKKCYYNEGVFPALQKNWLNYQRLVMPLGRGEIAEGLFVVCDFDDEHLCVRLPEALINAPKIDA